LDKKREKGMPFCLSLKPTNKKTLSDKETKKLRIVRFFDAKRKTAFRKK
jgi:hypothetical protein